MLPSKAPPKYVKTQLSWLLLCLFLAFLLVAYPVYVIRPFRHQGTTELAIALAVVQVRLYGEVALTCIAVLLCISCLRRTRRRSAQIGAGLIVLATAAFALLSRIDVYELMFNPLDQPSFADISHTRLNGTEQVIAIKVKGTARAYPIRDISYHHIVNDSIGGLAVVGTY